MNRISTKKSDTAKGPSRISTSAGSRSNAKGSTAGGRRTGPDPMPKVAVEAMDLVANSFRPARTASPKSKRNSSPRLLAASKSTGRDQARPAFSSRVDLPCLAKSPSLCHAASSVP